MRIVSINRGNESWLHFLLKVLFAYLLFMQDYDNISIKHEVEGVGKVDIYAEYHEAEETERVVAEIFAMGYPNNKKNIEKIRQLVNLGYKVYIVSPRSRRPKFSLPNVEWVRAEDVIKAIYTDLKEMVDDGFASPPFTWSFVRKKPLEE